MRWLEPNSRNISTNNRPRERMVDFIGIGAARSGTTWISNVLRRHPEIEISEPKEIRYFNRYAFPLGSDKGRLNPDYDRSLEWYLQHFRHVERRVKGEYSPIYLYDEAAPAAIKRSFPEVRLICSLRNPVDRAYSHFWLYRGSGMLSEMSFEEALVGEPVFLEMGFYARQLHRYLEHFDRDQLHVLLFDDLTREPRAEFGRILRFLGVREDMQLDIRRRGRNTPVNVRSKKLKLVAHATSRALAATGLNPVLRGLRRIGLYDLVNRLNSSGLRYPPMKPATRQHLIATYAEDIAALERLLDRDLGEWTTLTKDRPAGKPTTA
jgi:hypothetical protein